MGTHFGTWAVTAAEGEITGGSCPGLDLLWLDAVPCHLLSQLFGPAGGGAASDP